MKVIKNLTRCRSKNKEVYVFSPLAQRNKPRTRSDVTIWSLPEELLLLLLGELHIKDLLSMRAVYSFFRDVIDNNTPLWTNVNFYDTWPDPTNIKHFQKAAESGNIEALLKVGVAYLYSEGLPGSIGGELMTSNGDCVATMFCQAESLTPCVSPFTWLFIRPPWSTAGACCKKYVVDKMKECCDKDSNSSVLLCLAQILLLLEDGKQLEAMQYLEKAANQNSTHAAYMLWEQKQKFMVLDKANVLESIRYLRNIASSGHKEACLSLCNSYASGQYGGVTRQQATLFVREFVQSSPRFSISQVFQQGTELTHSMRYILVDWLVEVAGMKDFTSLTLHTAISVVDRYLVKNRVSRAKLQLLGVAAMVLCSRLLNREIITVREAAWLTDNTYKYEDVVRMMGEIISTLKGKIRVITILEYVQLFCDLAHCDGRTKCLAEYICEQSLLELTMLNHYSLARLAASCVLVARVTLQQEAWPGELQEFSGFSLNDLAESTIIVHERCYISNGIVDNRDVQLQAVKNRYGDETFCNVSDIKGVEQQVLSALFGIEVSCSRTRILKDSRRNPKHLIMSPSRHLRAQDRAELADRDQAGTPTLECNDMLSDSCSSGYDGDKEDADDSFMEIDDDEDPDLFSLWCTDNNDQLVNLSNLTRDSGMKSCCSSENHSSSISTAPFVSLRVKQGSHSDNDPLLSDAQDNQSSILIYNDISVGSNHSYETRLQTKEQSRPVLRSVNNGVASSASVNKEAGKRKSTMQLGNENKMHVMSS